MVSRNGSLRAERAALVRLSANARKGVSGAPPIGATRPRCFHLIGVGIYRLGTAYEVPLFSHKFRPAQNLAHYSGEVSIKQTRRSVKTDVLRGEDSLAVTK